MSPHSTKNQPLPPRQGGILKMSSVSRVGLDGTIIDGGGPGPGGPGAGRRGGSASSLPSTVSPSSSCSGSSSNNSGYPPLPAHGAPTNTTTWVPPTSTWASNRNIAVAGGTGHPEWNRRMSSSTTPATILMADQSISSESKPSDLFGGGKSMSSGDSVTTAGTSTKSVKSDRQRKPFSSRKTNKKGKNDEMDSTISKSGTGMDVVDELYCQSDDGMDEDGDGNSSKGSRKGKGRLSMFTGVGGKISEALCFLKTMVGVVLTCAAVFCGITVYYYLSTAEQERFETIWESDATLIMNSMKYQIQNTLDVADGFATSIISNAPNTWPLVTVPGFAKQSYQLMNTASGIRSVGLNMVVDSSDSQQIAAWEYYSNQTNREWIDETLQFQESLHAEEDDFDDDKISKPVYNYNTSYYIWGETTNSSSSVQLPLSQHYPVGLSWIYYNYNKDALRTSGENADDILAMLDTRQAVFGGLMKGDSQGDDGPSNTISYPVIDDSNGGSGDHPVVARMKLSFHWIDVLQKMLLPTHGVYFNFVLTDPCATSGTPSVHTFVLDNENEVSYLGEGDLHDGEFDDMEYTMSLYELMMENEKEIKDNTSKQAKDILLEDSPFHLNEACKKTISLYPMKETQKEYKTNIPIYLAALCVTIFIFTAVVFNFYDYLVIMRQKAVTKHAEVLKSIVTNLFPTRVHDQLYEKENEDYDANFDHGEEYALKSFRKRAGYTSNDEDDNFFGGSNKPPLAENFEESTVMFAGMLSRCLLVFVRKVVQY